METFSNSLSERLTYTSLHSGVPTEGSPQTRQYNIADLFDGFQWSSWRREVLFPWMAVRVHVHWMIEEIPHGFWGFHNKINVIYISLGDIIAFCHIFTPTSFTDVFMSLLMKTDTFLTSKLTLQIFYLLQHYIVDDVSVFQTK